MKFKFESDFIANVPFHIHGRFNLGNVDFINIYQVQLGRNFYHQWKHIDGVYLNWGEPVEFGEICNTGGSFGSYDFEAYFICETAEQFEAKKQELAKAMIERHLAKLKGRLNSLNQAVNDIERIIVKNN